MPLFFEALSTQLNQKRFMRLTWTATDDSDLQGYRIYRGKGEDFPPAEYILLGFTNANLYDDTSAAEIGRLYSYRITAIDNGDLESEPTTPSSDVHLQIPTLISPADKARVDRFPVFLWEPVQSAISYRVELMESPSGGILWDETIETNPSAESIRVPYLGFALQSGIPYYWRVQTYSKANAPANSTSEVRVFQTVP
ncbi:MAG: hypothetical protein CL946_11375 [Ectothiorhodospiraceae bacterium]|nr:hypothetical protein [Ectothiorhodospiraceae bacterium]